jgi:ligand-binding SRPBCC domain-containing protein
MPYRLERNTFIPRSREEVFAFFSDAGNLQKLTPAFLHFHMITPQPINMQAGTLIDYQLQLYGIPVRWRTLIRTFEPVTSFSDVQLKGPYRLWHHHHEFKEVPGGTEMRDTVDYEIPFGPLGAIARWLFVRRTLESIFDYRATVITSVFAQ